MKVLIKNSMNFFSTFGLEAIVKIQILPKLFLDN